MIMIIGVAITISISILVYFILWSWLPSLSDCKWYFLVSLSMSNNSFLQLGITANYIVGAICSYKFDLENFQTLLINNCSIINNYPTTISDDP